MQVSILTDAYQFVCLWGCTVTEAEVTAELFFCDSSLPSSITLTTRDKSQSFEVQIPDSLAMQVLPNKGQGLRLKRILQKNAS